MLILELKEIFQDHVCIFQDRYFLSSQIHQLTIMYHFEHRNHDIFKCFTSKSLETLFA